MYTLHRLEDAFEASAYQAFTFPYYRSQLQSLKLDSSIVAIAAATAIEPVGLVLAEIQPHRKVAQILSIFVASPYRRQGIGTALLREIESEMRSQDCTQLELVYITGKPTTHALERLLVACDWTAPQTRMLVGKSTCRSMMSAPWMQRTTLPASYSLLPWQEMTDAERTALRQQTWIPSQLTPFQHEKDLEPLNSLGLRYHKEIVGWIITHRLNAETIRYTSGFVRPDLQKAGRYISLLANAVHLQWNAKIPFGIWTVPFAYPGMVNFAHQRLAPYMSHSLEESRISSKKWVQHLVQDSNDSNCFAATVAV